MGEYLSTAIINRFSVNLSDLNKVHDDTVVACKLIADEIVSNSSIYNGNVVDDNYEWRLKPEFMEKDLLPFLERYYEDFYGSSSPSEIKDFKQVLNFLIQKPNSDVIEEWMHDNSYNCFGISDHFGCTTIVNGKRIAIKRSGIILSLEGKVMYESIYAHLSFFERALKKAYAAFPLGGSLVVEIN